MPRFAGPAATIDLQTFPLDPDPPEFELLFAKNQPQLDAAEQLLIPHQANVHTASLDAIADLDAAADVVAAIALESDTFGILDETGVIGDILDAAGQLDGTGPAPPVTANIQRLNISNIAIPFVEKVISTGPAPEPGLVFTHPMQRERI